MFMVIMSANARNNEPHPKQKTPLNNLGKNLQKMPQIQGQQNSIKGGKND